MDGKPLLRAYSVVSPNYEEHLEFLSIKVPDGLLLLGYSISRSVMKYLLVRKLSGHLLLMI